MRFSDQSYDRCVTNLIQQVEANKQRLSGAAVRAMHIKDILADPEMLRTYRDVVAAPPAPDA